MSTLGHPFYQAYINSDFLGKIIFLSLIATSLCCWSILVYKVMITRRVRLNSQNFQRTFLKYRNKPLNVEFDSFISTSGLNPFYELYLVLKKYTIEILSKNKQFSLQEEECSYLSSSDIDCIGSHLSSTIDRQTRYLESNLFILSTIVGLAPLLGLLGTVWGILISLSELQNAHGTGGASHMVLSGIALALTTTVLGLLNAIPALIAYNYLKNAIRGFQTDMEGIANEMLSSVEIQYRKV